MLDGLPDHWAEILGLAVLQVNHSSIVSLTIAAACAGRTVAGVIAIRAYLRGEHLERKRSRQL